MRDITYSVGEKKGSGGEKLLFVTILLLSVCKGFIKNTIVRINTLYFFCHGTVYRPPEFNHMTVNLCSQDPMLPNSIFYAVLFYIPYPFYHVRVKLPKRCVIFLPNAQP